MKFAANEVRRELCSPRTSRLANGFAKNFLKMQISVRCGELVRPPRTIVRRELIGDRDQLAKYNESWSVTLKVDGRQF